MIALSIRAFQKAVKKAIDDAARTNTDLAICENGAIKLIKPPYTYVRVPRKPSKTKIIKNPLSSKKKGKNFPSTIEKAILGLDLIFR